MPVTGRTGRRPGASTTRPAILDAARRLFAEQGYDRTTLRQVAAEAGVDPTLISHWFGSKQQLFVAVVELPFDPAEVIPRLTAGPPEQLGQRVAEFVLSVLESETGRSRMLGLIRAAAAEPEAARMVRDRLTRDLLTRLAAGLGADRPQYRASLAASQVVGLAMARHVVGIEPLASQDRASLAAAVAPTLQRYLTGELPD